MFPVACTCLDDQYEQIKRGSLLAKVLKLKKLNGHYLTHLGPKTPASLFRLVKHLVDHGDMAI